MKITFLGAAHEVTGSMTLIQTGGINLLVDCGMEQGRNIYQNKPLPVSADSIYAVILTHAHVDHSGNLPLLYHRGFRGRIFSTSDTKNLCSIMLRDCAHIKESEAEWASRKAKRAGRAEVEADYTMEDAEAVLELFETVPYGETMRAAEGVSVRFTDVGHLLGSAAAEVFLREGDEERKIVFSGDVGNIDQPIIKDPQRVSGADYVVIESTYGGRIHEYPRQTDPVGILAGYIQRALDRGGNVIIPSFAVGRTQEILYFIRQIKERGLVSGHDGFEVVVDSPLSVKATEIFMHCGRECLDDDALSLISRGINPISFDGLRTTETADESKALNTDPTPRVIISSAGMCDAGRIRHHLKHNLWNPNSMVCFVGYQSVGTLGRLLLDGTDEVKLFGETIAVRAEIVTLPSVSGHADSEHLFEWLSAIGGTQKRIFINHGDDVNSAAFLERLRSAGMRASIPFSGTEYDLLSDDFIACPEGIPIERADGTVREESVYDELRQAIGRLTNVAGRSASLSEDSLRGYLERIRSLTADIEKKL